MSASATFPRTIAPGMRASHAVSTGAGGTFSFGKYREIIIAVGFFLLFDLGVLVLNFYTSYQIAEDAVGINLSGRQRMLSQRTAKALLSVEAARARGMPGDAELLELRNAAELFDHTLQGFSIGGTVPGGDGKPLLLPAVQSSSARAILTQAYALWAPYQERLAPVLAGSMVASDLQAAADYARANNLKLLGLMNELTTSLEAVAANRANTLRLVQTVGIALALLNFAFILFKFLRQLRRSDAAIDAATEENREILSSVREGLFLMTPDFQLGSQISQSAHALFGQTLAPGDSFMALLTPLLAPKVLADARDYVDLLFSPHIKEALVQDINPLNDVQVQVPNRIGQLGLRHLSLHFNRVVDAGKVHHLLVTVQDISERKALEQKLKDERQRSQKEFNTLIKAFDADPAMLRQFVARSESSLLEINEHMRAISSTHGESAILQALDQAFRRIHALKGDAATLGLQTLADQAHQFESQLARIRDSGSGSDHLGDALLALPMHLEDLLSKVVTLKKLTHTRRPGPAALNQALEQLAHTVAADSGKRVLPLIQMGLHDQLPGNAQDLVREIAEQLIRNAVVHGIEAPSSRTGWGKPDTGKLEVNLACDAGQWSLRVRDDGAGLSAERIRQKLLDKGWYTAVQLENYSDPQIVGHIFKPGFSTADDASLHAGRGVGLDIVHANVQQLGAQLLLTSTSGQFTEFTVRFTP